MHGTDAAREFPVTGALDTPVVEPRLVVLEPRRGWQLINAREVWAFRELLAFLAWRDVKVRYKQTLLGVTWVVVQPVATMLVLSVFLGRLTSTPSDGLPYPLFVLAGLVPWMFFANAVTSCSQSIIANQNVVTKVYFPRLLIPISTVAAGLVDFLIGAVLLAALAVVYGLAPGWPVVMAPVIAMVLVGAALGVGTLLAALTVAYRDFRHVVGFGVQLWMFATPAIYMDSAVVVSPRWQPLLALNPAQGLIVNLRAAAFGGALDLRALAVSAAVSFALLLFGAFYFRRVERRFADIV